MEFIQVSGNTWALKGWQMIPVYRTDSTHCILMDTGAQYMREEIVQALEENHLTPIGLLCTHTHFDHFGNARFFREKYNCPVALPLGEAEICRTIDSVKSHLFVYPLSQIRSDPKMGEIPCLVDHIIRPEEHDTLFRGVYFRVLHTPGHGMDHCSYITPDNVVYIGDALMSGHSLYASKLPYAFDMHQLLDTIQKLHGLQAEAMIIAHCGVEYGGFDELAEKNYTYIAQQLEHVRALVDHPMPAGEVCRAVCREFGIRLNTTEKAQNLERFLRPYLECLLDDGTHKLMMQDGLLTYAPADWPEE